MPHFHCQYTWEFFTEDKAILADAEMMYNRAHGGLCEACH